jgi:hypothetical protein
MKVRKAKAEPSIKKSRTDTAEDMRAKPRNDNEEPSIK